MNKLLILIPLSLMVIGQVMSKKGAMEPSFFNIFVFIGYTALFLRGLVWIFILRKLPVSFAYPFMSLSFALVLYASYYFFNEPVTIFKLIGSMFIILGVILTSIGEFKKDG